jgi:hypothetical protein
MTLNSLRLEYRFKSLDNLEYLPFRYYKAVNIYKSAVTISIEAAEQLHVTP